VEDRFPEAQCETSSGMVGSNEALSENFQCFKTMQRGQWGWMHDRKGSDLTWRAFVKMTLALTSIPSFLEGGVQEHKVFVAHRPN